MKLKRLHQCQEKEQNGLEISGIGTRLIWPNFPNNFEIKTPKWTFAQTRKSKLTKIVKKWRILSIFGSKFKSKAFDGIFNPSLSLNNTFSLGFDDKNRKFCLKYSGFYILDSISWISSKNFHRENHIWSYENHILA